MLQRPVALKVVDPKIGRIERERIIRDAKQLASLQHPNVVEIYDAGQAGGLAYVAMRWIEGPDLASVVASGGPLAPESAVAVTEQVAAALDATHAEGLVHGDVRPANVFLCAADGHALLADFGLSAREQAAPAATQPGPEPQAPASTQAAPPPSQTQPEPAPSEPAPQQPPPEPEPSEPTEPSSGGADKPADP